MFDFSKLHGRIKEKFRNTSNFAVAMGTTRQNISNKLNNVVGWSQGDIINACKLLDIQQYEIGMYFFTKKDELS
mgnify:FL=1